MIARQQASNRKGGIGSYRRGLGLIISTILGGIGGAALGFSAVGDDSFTLSNILLKTGGTFGGYLAGGILTAAPQLCYALIKDEVARRRLPRCESLTIYDETLRSGQIYNGPDISRSRTYRIG